MPSLKLSKIFKEHWASGLVLLFALIHGFIYIFLIPPWQHYDEPGNFEFAWLIANQASVPQPGEYDQSMRRELAASMIEHNFFRGRGPLPNLLSQSEPIWIGIPQVNDRPLYYMLVAAPLRLVRTSDITFQLFLGRLVSLLLYLVAILAAYGVMTEITRSGNALRWIVPITIVLLPGFADLMTAINDDVGATALFSLFLWFGVRLIHKGFSWLRLLTLICAATLCFWIKDTAIMAVPLLLVPVLFSLFTGPRRRIAWSLIILGGVLGALLVFSWGDAAEWYRSTNQKISTRGENSETVLGRQVLQLEANNPGSASDNRSLFQPIPPGGVGELKGGTITIGAWMWASQPVETYAPTLHDGSQSYSQLVSLSTEPKFFAFRVTLPKDVPRLWLSLAPNIAGKSSGKNIDVFYDALVLVNGKCPVNTPPSFVNSDGNSVKWGRETFRNWLRNASAEKGGPRIRPWFDNLGKKIFPQFNRPSFFLYYLLDWNGVNWHYRVAGARLFRTFWAQFGWGNVSLIGHKPYRVLLIFTFAGLLGAGMALWRFRKELLWEVFFLLGLSALGALGLTFVRGATHLSSDFLYLPVARYAFPAIIPIVLVLSSGWLEVLRRVGSLIHLPKWGQFGLYFGLLLVLDVVSVISILRFYS
jgi:hypothetical protein